MGIHFLAYSNITWEWLDDSQVHLSNGLGLHLTMNDTDKQLRHGLGLMGGIN